MTSRRAEATAMAAICLAAVAVTWPLLTRLHGLPPENERVDAVDLLDYYGTTGAARTTVVRFGQFPLRSPWHSGGYPLYAHPEDRTLSPTMLLVLAVGPWAALKIEFVLLTVAGGIGMFILTRRRMGYSVVGALFSAASFAFGGFLMARWMRGWLGTTHAVWLPWMMYALWRGRERRWWLAVGAGLVAWLLISQKYVALVMGWFLVMVGLLRLDEEEPAGVGPAWGYFGRLVAVWAFGAGLAAAKLVPMWSLLRGHLGETPRPVLGQWPCIAAWAVILACLAVTPLAASWVRSRRQRLRGVGAIAAVVLAVLLSAAFLWQQPQVMGRTPPRWIRHSLECVVSFGGWEVSDLGERAPVASESYGGRAPVGPLVLLLAVGALIRRPRRTWKWAILAGLFLVVDFGLSQSVLGLPLLSLINRPREQLNFYLFFVLTLLAGRALHWRTAGREPRAFAAVAWGLLIVNAAYLGWNTHARLAYSVSKPLPPPPRWSATYHLLDRPAPRWRDHVCFLLRRNIGLKRSMAHWPDRRSGHLVPSLLVTAGGEYAPNPAFTAMVHFDDPGNEVKDWTLTPSEIAVTAAARRPGVLVINQVADDDWHLSEGRLVPDVPLLAVRLSRIGEYEVRLRYVPSRLSVGLAFSGGAALVGGVLLALTSRRRGAAGVWS